MPGTYRGVKYSDDEELAKAVFDSLLDTIEAGQILGLALPNILRRAAKLGVGTKRRGAWFFTPGEMEKLKRGGKYEAGSK